MYKFTIFVTLIFTSQLTLSDPCPPRLASIYKEISSIDIKKSLADNIKAGKLGFMESPSVSLDGVQYLGLPRGGEMELLTTYNWGLNSIKARDLLSDCQIKIINKAKENAQEYNRLQVDYIENQQILDEIL